MRALLEDAARRAIDYLEAVSSRPVAPTAQAVAALAGFDERLPSDPRPADDTLRRLDEVGSPATAAMASGRYFGFVIGGALPVTLASNWLATAWDQNTGLHAPTPATATIERVALDWLLDVLELPAGAGGAFVTGATMANFCGLAAARHAVLARAGWDVEADGLFGAPPVTVAIGDEAHPTLVKGLGLLGLGRRRVVRLPVDGQGRVEARALPRLPGPAIVCLQAGNVNTGAFDALEPLIDAAHEQGAWVHVDGAFGLWARASAALRPLVAGVERADSWATDAHKWLNVPYDCGIGLVRDAASLRASMAVSADYLPAAGGALRDPADYTPELSRRARGVDVWAALRTLGRSGVAALVERCCGHARRFARELGAAGATVLNDVVLNQVLVSFGDAETTRRVVKAVQDDGTCWCGITVWQGRTAMRISVCSWATTDDDVTLSVAAIERLMKREQGR